MVICLNLQIANITLEIALEQILKDMKDFNDDAKIGEIHGDKSTLSIVYGEETGIFLDD